MYAEAAAIKGCVRAPSFLEIFWLLEPRMSLKHNLKSPWYSALTWARVKSHREQIFVGRNQSCSLTFNAIERQFLFCSLPKPCAACHTGKVGNMELQSRSKRRSQMPMCPPDISTGTPWKKWVDSSLNRIRPKNQQEHGQQKKHMFCCVVGCGGSGCCYSLPISLVRHLVYQRLLGTNDKSIKKHRKIIKMHLPEKIDTSKVKN